MEPETITLAIKYLRSAGFPGEHKFPSEKTALWLDLFSDIPDKQFIEAIKEIVKTSKFFPTVADIRKTVFKSTRMLPESAWAEVLGQMQKVCGTGMQPTYSSNLIESVVRSLGGLNTIWQAGVESESYYRTMFVKTYSNISEKEEQDLMIGEPTGKAGNLLDNLSSEIKGIE